MSVREVSRNMRLRAEAKRPVTRDDPRNHWCQHPGCKAWGLRGYPGGVWLCAKHRPEDGRP